VNRKAVWLPWICWAIPAVAYLIQYGLLVVPASIAKEIETSLSLNAFQLGVFYSAFLYTYVLMQVPVGLLFDRFNAKTLLTLSIGIMALGSVFQAFAHGLAVGIISRMLMGFGGSFVFVGALYLGRIWFKKKMFPLIIGLTEAMSGIGAIAFGTLFSDLSVLALGSWRNLLLQVTIFTVIICVLAAIFVRERKKKSTQPIAKEKIKENTKTVFKNLNIWLVALYVGFGFTHYMTLTNMWQIQFLVQKYRIPTVYAVLENAIAVLGFTIGGPLAGFLTRYSKTTHLMIGGSLIQIICLMLINYFSFNIAIEAIFLLSMGLATGTIVLGFEMVREEAPPEAYGVAAGMINMFFGGFSILVSPLVGYLYSVSSHNVKVSIFPVVICSVLSILFCFALIIRKQRGTLFPKPN